MHGFLKKLSLIFPLILVEALGACYFERLLLDLALKGQ